MNARTALRFALSALIVGALVASAAGPALADGLFPLGEKRGVVRLSDEVILFRKLEDFPVRPAFPIEVGDPFLDTGPLNEGFKMPGGANWQPRLWGFLNYRTAVQVFDNGIAERAIEWANRLDIFANLQLTGTEKLIVGLRPLDKNRPGQFTRYAVEPDNRDGGIGEFNVDVQTLFFEGDVGSLLPDLDRKGMRPIDFGFAIGRQALNFQEGILINDTVDSLGVIRNNIPVAGTSNVRATAIWGWHRLDRNDARTGSDPQMFGLFAAIDAPTSTINIDAIFVDDDVDPGDGLYFGVASIQRIGEMGTAFRVNTSLALDDGIATVDDGVLISAEVSWRPHASDDIVYVNPFVGLGRFTQAGREPILGGPLASLGILFASRISAATVPNSAPSSMTSPALRSAIRRSGTIIGAT